MVGDDDFKQLFFENYPKLLQLADSFVRSREVAEEIVQDVFINIWQKKVLHGTIDSIEGYLHVAVKNHSFNYLKSKYHKDHSGFLAIADDEPHLQSEHNKLEANELEAAIENGIMMLPEKCRIIFLMSRDQEMSYQEIASHLDVSRETVKSKSK